MVTAMIGLGSNLADPKLQIQNAREAIARLPITEERGFSSLYASPPMGPQDQPDYVNAVMAITTELSARKLLQALQGIENQQGRLRERRWGERTLDLDILVYGDVLIDEPDLVVPHYGIADRSFVLYPLQDVVEQGFEIPGKGALTELLKDCPKNGLYELTANG